jgi:hypothetical protein
MNKTVSNPEFILKLTAILLWLIGLGILYWFGRMSILSFIFLSFFLGISSFSSRKIKPIYCIGMIAIGILWIWMSYIENVDPMGISHVTEYWIGGLIIILSALILLARNILID